MSCLVDAPTISLYSWLHDRIELPWSPDFRALGKLFDGELVAVVGYNQFTGTSCHMHMAVDNPKVITKSFLKAAFRYPFIMLNHKIVFGVVIGNNKKSLDIDLRLGFKELLYIPEAHPDGGIHLLAMKRDECRWIKRI